MAITPTESNITYLKTQTYEVKDGVAQILCDIACTSDDTKPTTNIVKGSLCLEVNTGKMYAFDGSSWNEI